MLCVPGLGRLDDCVALVVADVLKREGFNTRISGIDTEIDNADTICVCFVEEVTAGRAAFTARKFARRAAAANIITRREILRVPFLQPQGKHALWNATKPARNFDLEKLLYRRFYSY